MPERATIGRVRVWSSFVAGVIFALGLGLSGMTDANKVLNFLNIAGSWDYDLMLVMGSALAVYAPAFRIYRRRRKPLLGNDCNIPDNAQPIDRQLIIGAALFGVGWGLGGFCPGPGLVAMMSHGTEALVFVSTMLVGIIGYRTVLSPKC